MFHRKHPAGSSKRSHDFVRNEQRLSAITPFADSPQGAGRPKTHPGSSLNERLDHDRGNLSYLGWRKPLQCRHVWDLNCRKIPMRWPNLKHGCRAQAGCACRIAMVTAFERDELMPSRMSQPPILIGDPQGDFDSCRTIVRKKDSAQRVLREKIDNCTSEFDRSRVGEAKK